MDNIKANQLDPNDPLLSNESTDTQSSSSNISLIDQSTNDMDMQKKKEDDDENQRFTQHSPLVSLLIFSIGPLSNVASLLFETISMFFITKRFGETKGTYAIEILGFSQQYQSFLTIIGMFFGQVFITRMGSLIGSGQREAAIHLTSDIFRLIIISTIIYSIPMFFVIKPFLKFVGTPDYMIEPAFKYNFVLLCFSLFSNLLSSEQSFIYSIGRPILSAIICVVYKGIQCLALDPLFLFLCKVPTMIMKLSKIVIDIGFSIALFVTIFAGKFSLKPTMKMFLSFKFSKETLKSLLFPIPFTFAFATSLFPPMIILKALTDSAKQSGQSQSIGGAFAVYSQLNGLGSAIPSMLTTSLMATGMHAYSSGNIKRLKHLLFWSFVIAMTFSILFSLSMILFKVPIASLFIHDEEELQIAAKMLPIPFYTSSLSGFDTIAMALLMIIGKPLLVMIPTILSPCNLIISCFILKKIFKDDYIKLMYSYNISGIISLLIYIGMFIYAIKVILKTEKEKDHLTSANPITENLLAEN
ncbi:hypothetical protein M9Y10_003978 [Tritrichomonas musculus]|uniref:MatE family protein n=1 Tax=Tritrichomonas musculus TaxID=1915356 RepID=A0ABR2JRC3_9EUKA